MQFKVLSPEEGKEEKEEKGKSIETERKSVVPGAEGRSELGVTA